MNKETCNHDDRPSAARCEFQLLRYVPDPVRNEFVHIGVILREQERPGSRCGRRWSCALPATGAACAASIRTPTRRCSKAMESELRMRLQHDPEGKLMRLLESRFP